MYRLGGVEIADAAVERCAIDAVLRLQFRKDLGGPVKVAYPFKTKR